MKTIFEIIKYGLVGIVGLLVDYGTYRLLVFVFNVHYPFADSISELFLSLGIPTKAGTSDALISSIIGAALGAINNFILNSYFTFKVSDQKLKRFASYSVVAVIGIVLSTIFMTIMLDYMHLDKNVSKIAAIVLVAAIQFVINKFIVFRKKTTQAV